MKAKAKKAIRWLKKHLILTAIVVVVLIWGAAKLMPFIFAKLYTPPGTYVETIVIKLQPGVQRWEAVGTVKAAQDIVVASEVSGTIQELLAEHGKTVKQGEVLLTIRHDDISAHLQKAQAELTQKELYHQRIQQLIKTNAASKEALSKASSEYQQAKAAVNAAQALLDKYVIKAPFAGLIGIWRVDVGQLVQPGNPLVTLTALSPAYIDFMLPAKALGIIKVNDKIQFTTSSYDGQAWSGQVVAIDPQLDSSTRGISVRAVVDNADGKLVPRLYGQVAVLKPLPPQLFIPQEAVIYDPQGASVYLVQDKIAKLQHITLGVHQGNDVVVVKGLKADDEVVTAGMMKLFPEMPVVTKKREVQTSILTK